MALNALPLDILQHRRCIDQLVDHHTHRVLEGITIDLCWSYNWVNSIECLDRDFASIAMLEQRAEEVVEVFLVEP